MTLSSLRIVTTLALWSFTIASPVCAAGAQSGAKAKGAVKYQGVVRGTINVFLANPNGIVVLTDSRLTNMSTMLALPDPAQKLFQLDSRTVATFAGFASEPLRMDPEVANTTADVIQSYGADLSSKYRDNHLTLKEKLAGLTFILQNQLELITEINKDPPQGTTHDLELTMAGYDVDGLAKMEWVDLGLRQIASYPHHSVSASEPQEEVIGLKFTYRIRGIPNVAHDILENPTRYLAEPSVARYAASMQDGGTPLTVEEMQDLAKFLAHRTASEHSGVAGPDQIAILQAGVIRRIDLPQFSAQRARRRVPFLLMWDNIFDPPLSGAEPIASVRPRTLLFANNTVRGWHVVLDGGYFFGNVFSDCVLEYGGGRTKFVDGGNDVANSVLVLGPRVHLNSPEVKQLRGLTWRRVEYERSPKTSGVKSHRRIVNQLTHPQTSQRSGNFQDIRLLPNEE